MLLRTDIDELVAIESEPAVSLYLPTHVAGREIRQDPIRFKNLLGRAAEQLAVGRRSPDLEALLTPARRLLDDEEFWRHQEHGLAVFLAPQFSRFHRLPIAPPQTCFVGSHFCIKPLLPLLDDAGPFWLLAISASRTRLYQGSRWTFADVAGLDLPQGVAEIRNESNYQETHKASPTGRPQRGPAGLARAQGFGDTPEELRKTELIELLHRIATAVDPVLKRQPAPVILAAHPEIQGNFRKIAKWKELQPQGLGENPDAMDEAELHRRAYALVEPHREEARRGALGHFESLLGTGNPKASTKAEEIIKAARWGRIDELFLGDAEPLWGRFDEAADRIVAHGSAGVGDEDLLDYAALMTLRQGGRVTLVDRALLPPDGPVAAILRYEER
ncbi:MAG: hypothetical protein JO267_14215 [Alphaproteobacteria bacterium]|nr:hypothetical protein [Alphaproteobacteria bacterium]